MFNLFNKNGLLALLATIALNSSLIAWDSCCDSFECHSCPCNRMYVGAFGGVLYSDSTKLTQQGTAFFIEAQGGPLAVLAEGRAKRNSTGFAGVQIGYEWAQCPHFIGCTNWSITPAAELEAYFFSHNKRGHLINPTERIPEHDFVDSFHMRMGVGLVNAVFYLNNPCFSKFTPYVGGGIGATHLSLRNAKSIQVDPPEEGVNHFNSKRNDCSWAFAAQAKVGLRYNICDSIHIFGEYRYLYVDSSNYIFGSTVFPGHAATSPWNVKVRNIHYNAFAIGVQYGF